MRNVSIHAGGVGIVDTKITDYMPMKLGSKGEHVIQVDKKKVEEIGIIKFDVLGVATLAAVQEAMEDIGLSEWDLSMQKLKYAGYDIVFQEVPGEISLAINITNCPYHCSECHSSYLANDFGDFVDDDIDKLLDKHSSLITCVCFMGGDQAMDDLKFLLEKVKAQGLKTCVYSGAEDVSIFKTILHLLDYLKIGPYIKTLGGLDSSTTNQKFFRVANGEICDLMNDRFVKKTHPN